jgi:hypothetical protein|nr:MAG TPA: hypothetical protein [Caudoviricetes sp.]
MGKFNEYTQKATPADNDTLMIYDATSKANKLSPFSGIWNWIVGKLTNAVISNLQTSNKSVIGALNELNSKAVTGKIPQFYSNIDKINGASIIVATARSDGTLPKKIGGNRYMIITDASFSESGLTYAVQFAIGFGSSTIAIRNCNYTAAGNGKYSEWRYI